MKQVINGKNKVPGSLWKHPLVRKYVPLVHGNLTAVYARDLRKWLVIVPIFRVATGLLTTTIAVVILQSFWAPVIHYYPSHQWAIVLDLLLGLITALIMQFFTPDPDEHSTGEIIRSYHERQVASRQGKKIPNYA